MTPPPSTRGGRRAELLEAAVDVVAESGLRGLTHRAVDARAGLPEGTCSAYLRTRLALLIGLTEHVGGLLARDVDAMAAKAAPHAEDPDAISAAVTDLLLHWLHRPEIVRTQAELALEAARRPELMDVFDPWRQGLVRVVEELVRCAGPRRPRAARRGRRGRHRGRARIRHPDAVRPPARVRARRGAPRRPRPARHRVSATRCARGASSGPVPRLAWRFVDVRSAPC